MTDQTPPHIVFRPMGDILLQTPSNILILILQLLRPYVKLNKLLRPVVVILHRVYSILNPLVLEISTKYHQRGVDQRHLDRALGVLEPPLRYFERKVGFLGYREVRLQKLDCRLKVGLLVNEVLHF